VRYLDTKLDCTQTNQVHNHPPTAGGW